MEPILLCKETSLCCSAQKKDVEKVGIASEEGILIKSTVEEAAEITNDDAKTIQIEKDVQMEVPNAANEKELKEVVLDIEKEYGDSESMGEVSLKPLLIFPLPVEESDHGLLILYVD